MKNIDNDGCQKLPIFSELNQNINDMYMSVVHANKLSTINIRYIYSLYFPINAHITKTVQFHKLEHQQGQFYRSWSYLFPLRSKTI